MEKIITEKEIIENYYNTVALNQSKLKKLQYGPDYFLKEDEENNADYFIIGSALDCLLTHEYDFNEEFVVCDIEEPGQVVKDIVTEVFKQKQKLNVDWGLEKFKGLIESIIEMNGYFNSNWKMETKVNEVLKKGTDYFNKLVFSNGKKILSTKNYELVKTMRNSIENTKSCSIFNKDISKEEKNLNMVYIFQAPKYFSYKGFECKALLDVLIIDHDKKEVSIVDLKTTSKRVVDFAEPFFKFGYDIQLAWYGLPIKEEYKDYNISYKMIVESTTFPGNPCCFLIEENVVNKGLEKIDKLLDDLSYYEKNSFKVERRISENNNLLKITEEDMKKFV